MNLGKAIKLCRHQKEMTQSDLAKKANISLSYLSLIEQNKRHIHLSSLNRLSKALQIPVSILIFLASNKEELKGIPDNVIDSLSKVLLDLIKHKQ